VPHVKYGIEVSGFGTYSEASVVADVAALAEQAGWDGVFIWDHLGWVLGYPCGDPFVSMTAAAVATTGVRLGFDVVALPRRRPQVVATAVAALDRLSHGRVILGVGLGGVPREYEAFGEDANAPTRAARLDEGLHVLRRLWTGEPVHHRGDFYVVDGVKLVPLPAQHPHPPIWVGGTAPSALRRAAKADGYTAGEVTDESGSMILSPNRLHRRLEVIGRGDGFDVAVSGQSVVGDDSTRNQYAAAGATWWLESITDRRANPRDMLDRIRQGP
jgi:alkanesulfonate monooxygenase SsuD/methylene tetrahydromethanopterin reductase-like flavin-dependent oxidoreductase (luciferase family)